MNVLLCFKSSRMLISYLNWIFSNVKVKKASISEGEKERERKKLNSCNEEV